LTIAGVADTHTALWHLFDDKRLFDAAENFINEAATARRKIAISTISKTLPLVGYAEITHSFNPTFCTLRAAPSSSR